MSDPFAALPEQEEAKRLLRAALAEGPAHAYLFHGPRGVGKRGIALAFAGALLGAPERTARRAHPDLYVLEPLGEMIRIDAVRELRRDLHMRPFEADRRVYLILDADALNEDAADALLKDLEEPPPYATIVLVASELGPLPETIRSRCQLVPFRRLSERAVRTLLAERAPGLGKSEVAALARVAAGRLDRAERLLDPAAKARREVLVETARSVYREADFEPHDAATRIVDGVSEAGAKALDDAREALEGLGLPDREAEQRAKRIRRGAEKEELLAALEELAAWYRDLVAVAVGAEGAAIHCDRLDELREDALRERMHGAEGAAEAVRQAWRELEELNLNWTLQLEALFVRARRELAGYAAVAS
jgi:DNA polymerase-3 subunit delta'